MTEKQKRFEELSNRALNGGYTVYSDFLGLSELSELFAVHFSTPVNLWGGYTSAERVIACFGDRNFYDDSNDYPINCIMISPVNQKFADTLSHRDFLGSLMGLGIRREMLGDIIINENCGYLFAMDSICDYIIDNLTQVKHTTVKCSKVAQIPESALPQPERTEFIVSSERLDVLVSAVYNLSRSKTQILFNQEKVFINGVSKSVSTIGTVGDKISVRGFGRFIYNGVLRRTKKDRLVVEILIYK